MAIRPIDGEELLGITRLLDTDVVRQSKTASWLLDQVLHDIQAMPTLTPPNEPLTLEQLREMDGEPVVIDGTWYYLEKIVDGIAYCWRWYMDFADEWPLDQYGETWLAYLRPPEGEA